MDVFFFFFLLALSFCVCVCVYVFFRSSLTYINLMNHVGIGIGVSMPLGGVRMELGFLPIKYNQAHEGSKKRQRD